MTPDTDSSGSADVVDAIVDELSVGGEVGASNCTTFKLDLRAGVVSP